jgi:hypothetical protein
MEGTTKHELALRVAFTAGAACTCDGLAGRGLEPTVGGSCAHGADTTPFPDPPRSLPIHEVLPGLTPGPLTGLWQLQQAVLVRISAGSPVDCPRR